MASLADVLEQLVKEGAFTKPKVIGVGKKSVQIPPPQSVSTNPPVLRSTATFPDGDPDVADFARTLGILDFGDLPKPFSDIADVALEGLSIDFAQAGYYPSGYRVQFGYSGTRIGFQDSFITGIHLICEGSMPVDPLLSAVTVYAKAEIVLDDVQSDVEIDSKGRASFLLNDGKAISFNSILNLTKKSGFSFGLPVPEAKLENALVVLDTQTQTISLSADFKALEVDFDYCKASLNHLWVELGKQNAASIVASGAIGKLCFSGVIELPGGLTLTAHVPPIELTSLIDAALPNEKTNLAHLNGIELPDATLTLTKNETVTSLAVATQFDPAHFVPQKFEAFLKSLGVGVPDIKVDTDLLIVLNPLKVRFRVSLLGSFPIQPANNSSAKIDGLWLEIDVAETEADFGLAVDVSFNFHVQTFEFSGIAQVGDDGADLQAGMKQPAIWKNALGIKGLELSALVLELGFNYEGIPTFGLGGKFGVTLPGSGRIFAGHVAFLFKADDPGTSVIDLSFNHIDLSEVFDLFFPGLSTAPINKLLQQFGFSQCEFYFSPEGCTIDNVPYPSGYRLRGEASFFHWASKLDVAVSPTQGIDFECEMEKAVQIAGIFELSDAAKSGKGPKIALTTHPSAGQHLFQASGLLKITGVFSETTDVVFDETQFHINLETTLFQTADVRVKADAEFANLATAGLAVTLELVGLDSLEKDINAALKRDAKAAASKISQALQSLKYAEKRLAPVKLTYEQRQGDLNRLIRERDAAPWYKYPYWEAQVVVVQGEVSLAKGAYDLAMGALDGAVDALSKVRTIENVALNEIAAFIDDFPIQLKSVSCRVAASALHESKFTVDIDLSVNKVDRNLRVEVDFNDAQMLDQLGADIQSGIVDLFR